MRSPRSVLRAAARGQRRDLVLAALLVAAQQLAEAAVPVAVGVVIDLAIARGDGGTLLRWLGAVVVVFVVLAACGFGYWLAERTEHRAAHDVRLTIAERVLDPAGGAPGRAGELVSVAGSDAERAGQVCRAIIVAAGALAALAGGAVVLLGSSTPLGLVVLGGVPTVLVASRLLTRPLIGRAEAEQAALAATTGVATDLVTGLRVLKGIGAERAAAQGYRRASRDALRARLAATAATGGYTALTGVITGAFMVSVAWIGGRLALDGQISVGELVAAVGLAQFLMGPLEELTSLGPVLAGARGSAGRVAAVLAAPPAVRAGTRGLTAPSGSLQVGRITIPAGQHVGIVAPHDAEALIDVLARDTDGDAGVDGVDLRELTLDDARAAVLVARHDAALFEGTVAENLGVDVEAPAAALAAAAADQVVEALPAGLDAELAERGRELSGGQRQRLALARALAADPPVLVLHEPTTAVDAATEHRIASGITALRAGRTTVLVTSSPALLSRCERVLLVHDGVVVAEGSHAELLADARYRDAVLA